jgi:hexosaminidase
VLWSYPENKNFEDFKKRLEVHKVELDSRGYNYFGKKVKKK